MYTINLFGNISFINILGSRRSYNYIGLVLKVNMNRKEAHILYMKYVFEAYLPVCLINL